MLYEIPIGPYDCRLCVHELVFPQDTECILLRQKDGIQWKIHRYGPDYSPTNQCPFCDKWLHSSVVYSDF